MAQDRIDFADLPVDNCCQDEHQTARPTHLLLEITPIGMTTLAIVDMPGQGMQLLALEQPAPYPATESRISEIIQNEDRLVDPAEFADRTIKMIAGTAGQEALQCYR